MRSTRWCVIAFLATTAAVLPSPAGGSLASADAEPGSGFANYLLAANAPTLSIVEDNDKATAHPEAEGELPQSVSTLGSTGGSYGLSTAAWPGALAGNLGTLLIAASGGGVPDQVSVLNYPVRAEAKNNAGTVTNTGYPGLTMTATSRPASSSAQAELTGADAASSLSVHNTRAESSTRLAGPASARASSKASLQALTIAGVVKIASIQSTASAVSDGVKAAGAGSTTLQGATVAGVPVTIDDTGVHAATAHEVVPGQAQQTVNTALAQLGMSVNVVGPTTTAKGGMVRYVAASFVFTWLPPPPSKEADTHETIVLALGGAFAGAQATPAYVPSPG
ncbi:MAG: hypothetical protein QOE58_1034, partial [Actinomycetota bacterium]|nr:hypothetical protein [Actinomycetota bacterium]